MPLEPGRPRAGDPLSDDPRVSQYLGSAWDQLDRFHGLLTEHGVGRGLIGPREPARLWERHLLNCAGIVPLLERVPRVLDLGSGAGLPGVVVAAMMPATAVTLLEPMERRFVWLTEVVEELRLTNVEVVRGRAEDVADSVIVEAVIARAVGNLARLYRWAGPLLASGGRLVALKGARATEEAAESVLAGAEAGFGSAAANEVRTIPGVASTWVILAYKNGVERGTR